MNQEMLKDVELDSDNNESPKTVESPQEDVIQSPYSKMTNENDNDTKQEDIKQEEEVTNEDENDKKVETWWDSAYKLGENILYVADFLCFLVFLYCSINIFL